MARELKLFVCCVTVGLLAACGNDGELRRFRDTTPGPEEFNVVPSKPLETPPSFASLPPPTPGGNNRVDQTPLADAVAALGGNPSALNATGIPASDNALVSYASRGGVDPQIRTDLKQEDEKFRRRESAWASFNPMGVDRYFGAYQPQSLDPVATAELFRRRGIATPSFPRQ